MSAIHERILFQSTAKGDFPSGDFVKLITPPEEHFLYERVHPKDVERVAEAVFRYSYEIEEYGKPRFPTLMACIPPNSWFRDFGQDVIHGSRHVAQLLVLGAASRPFSRAVGIHMDMEVFGWTAVLHDMARDRIHHQTYPALWAKFHLSPLIPAEKLDALLTTVALHAVSSDRIRHLSHDLKFFKTMDKLALVRLGEDVSNMAFHIRGAHMHLPQLAQELEDKSKKAKGDRLDMKILRAAEQMRLILP